MRSAARGTVVSARRGRWGPRSRHERLPGLAVDRCVVASLVVDVGPTDIGPTAGVARPRPRPGCRRGRLRRGLRGRLGRGLWGRAARGSRAPFGGFGASGFGRSSGQDGLLEYTQPKAVWVETSAEAPLPSATEPYPSGMPRHAGSVLRGRGGIHCSRLTAPSPQVRSLARTRVTRSSRRWRCCPVTSGVPITTRPASL